MLSTRIDLTENNDFSRGSLNRFSKSNVILDKEKIKLYHYLSDSKAMSTNEFGVIEEYENVFGKKYHDNDINFSQIKFNYDVCVRCGKPLNIPWKRTVELCIDCEIDLRNESRLPWKNEYVQMSGDSTRDIFLLR